MRFKALFRTDWLFLLVLVIIAIFIRSLNYPQSLNFSSDQGKFAIKALEIIRGENEGFSLIGPSTSLQLDGREIFQGGVIYYFLALFLLLGNLDPIKTSFIFMLFSCLMVIPLYFGVKFLTDKNRAILISVLFALSPIFINYTKFLWNPNFQLTLLAGLFLLLGLYKRGLVQHNKKSLFWILGAGIWFGFIFQFHYQLFIGGLLLLLYLKFYLKSSFLDILIFISGCLIGFTPILIFELRNNFYNLNTLIFYLQNFNKFRETNSQSNIWVNQHYILSLLMILLVILFSFFSRVSKKLIFLVFMILLIWDVLLFYPKPSQGFGMIKKWSYLDESKAFEIIKSQNLEKYNVTNLGYDTLAYVQKYLHKKDQLELTDYWEMEKLFIIAPKSRDIYNDPAYETQVIKPFTIINQWEINPEYNLYLVSKNTTEAN